MSTCLPICEHRAVVTLDHALDKWKGRLLVDLLLVRVDTEDVVEGVLLLCAHLIRLKEHE
jgi:hypothetical protein